MTFIRKYKRNGRIYLAEVKNQRVDGKVKQKFIRYIGVEPDSDRDAFPTCNKELSLDGVKVHGSILALNSVSKLIGLHDLLGEDFAPILSLVFCHCHDYKGVKNMKRWLSNVNFCDILKVNPITEEQLHKAISAVEDMDIMAIEKSIFEKMKSLFNDSGEGVVYDVTNTYLRGSASELAQKGHDKEGVRGRRLIQVGLGMTAEKRIPIFHQVHPGNTSDSKMFQEGIEHLQRFNVKRGIIVYDRGMHAKNSILRLANTRWKLVGGVPLKGKARDFVSKMDFTELENYRNMHKQGDSVLYAKPYPYEFGGVKGRLIVILNAKKKNILKEKRFLKLEMISQNNKEIPLNYKIFFNINGKINSHAVKRVEAMDGVSALFVTGKISMKEAIYSYYDKDLIEKSFRSLKTVLGLRPIRHWLDEKITGHLFICYLSLVLLTTFRLLLDQKGRKSVCNMSAEKALKELESVYIIKYSNKNKGQTLQKPYQKVITLSNIQRDISSAIMPELCL